MTSGVRTAEIARAASPVDICGKFTGTYLRGDAAYGFVRINWPAVTPFGEADQKYGGN